ncbi:MAG TPA: DciA family protein [Rhabdaerophilum sp.]|nr:DciA family protein [Rhabdaerophilum sp.]
MTGPATKATRLPRKGTVALGDLVPEAVAAALRERGFASSTILTQWREIIGPHLAQWTHPVEIRWPRRPGEAAPAFKAATAKQEKAQRAVLVVGCPGAFALDIQMASAAIIEAVNRRLGFGCVGSLQIAQMPQPEPSPPKPSRELDPALVREIEAGLSYIEAPDLRRALAELGAGIAQRSGQHRHSS